VRNPGAQYPSSQPQPQSGGPPWAPSNHWGGHAAAQQQSQSFNPYKKVPRPPEAGYYDYKLSDNPLGLEGMVLSSRNDPSREHGDGDSPQTPWIWNPPTLRESNDRPIADRGFGQSGGDHNRMPPRRATIDNYGRGDGVHAPMLAQRSTSNDIPSQFRSRPPPQNPIFGSSSGPIANIPGFVPNPQPVSHQPVAQHTVQPSESFTEKKELQNVFSSQIIRTPDHYHRKNIEASRQANIYRPGGVARSYIPRSQNAIDEMNGVLGTGGSSQPLERHSSLPTSLPSLSSSSSASMVGLANYTDEPSSLLSPLIGATPKVVTGPLGRARTDPPLNRSHTLSSIAETSSSLRGDIGFAPLAPPKDNFPFVPLQPSRDRLPTPHPRRENPLPPPPVDTQRSSPSPQGPPPAHYSRKVRKGFWNKRGDHLTSDLHVVYAPPDKVYPAELAGYPDGKEGYLDAYLNHHVPWIEERPELPASLPQRGRPPTQPYESFVVYGYLP
jgi:hypothetical protein